MKAFTSLVTDVFRMFASFGVGGYVLWEWHFPRGHEYCMPPWFPIHHCGTQIAQDSQLLLLGVVLVVLGVGFLGVIRTGIGSSFYGRL